MTRRAARLIAEELFAIMRERGVVSAKGESWDVDHSGHEQQDPIRPNTDGELTSTTLDLVRADLARFRGKRRRKNTETSIIGKSKRGTVKP